MPTANEIRQQFIDFFVQKHGHTFVPSSPVVPQDDPTLLFTNAGMNQFKDVFLGTGTRPYKRAVDTQKCIRAGGKHNDLDDVGKDTYHHTFFEMLGNWSFGDYYKAEAIRWAWDLLTKEWGLDKSRLHATVFGGDKEFGLEPDDEALRLWTQMTDIDPAHVHRFGKKDNFWMMGDTGPCGPCSEIHFDRTPDRSGGKLVNQGDARVIEIWNLVFIQYNRDDAGKLHPLPAKHVDTGMGFERITAVLQGKESNYDTDIFAPIFRAIQKIAGAPAYTGKLDDFKDTAYRVIADHIRALTFALTDGAVPSNEKRGYVVRSILRRAERYGRQYLGTGKPFLHELVPTVVEVMGGAFPELKAKPTAVAGLILDEEKAFLRTLDRGIKLFQDVVERTRKAGGRVISGDDAFDLHTTYGFFIDIVEQMAAEVNLGVDREGFQRRMEGHRALSAADTFKASFAAIAKIEDKTEDHYKWSVSEMDAKVLGEVPGPQGSTALVLDKTCFYSEAGGQVGDKGRIAVGEAEFEVTSTVKSGDQVFHLGRFVKGTLDPKNPHAKLRVARDREFTMKNHTATHLLNWALRKVLGPTVDQKGSLVDPDKTRFDFSHDEPLTSEQVTEVESLVNEKIYADLPVKPVVMPLAEAKKLPGVRAVFGEKYPDPVRVLLIGADRPEDVTPEHSVEFCGGTHLTHTGQAGFFKIVSQEAVGKGVRRITGVTGREAVATVQKLSSVVDSLTARFRCQPEDVPARVEALQEEIKKLQQQLKKGAATDLQDVADKLFSGAADVKGVKVIVGEVPAAPEDQVRQQIDRLRQKAGSAVVLLGWSDDGKVQLLAAVTDDLVKKGLHAGKLVCQVAKVVGGGGGGKPTMAQAGGKEPARLGEALELGKKLASEQLGAR